MIKIDIKEKENLGDDSQVEISTLPTNIKKIVEG